MKRTKIMLFSFALLAVVAGAIAFKAKGPNPICYRTTAEAGPNPLCPLSAQIKTTDDEVNNLGKFYTTDAVNLPGFGLTCYTWKDQTQTETTTLPCPISEFVTTD